MSQSAEILFGDIHNHNALGYGIGSLERAIDIAQTHLDFFAFTGHSSWHDMVPMEGGRESHWLKGFEKLKSGWGKVQELIADANRVPDFNAFLGFEWHSSRFGDQCVVFADDFQPLVYPDHISDLRKFCRQKQALMIPHHIAYPEGHRGVNWSVFDECCTPVVEVFSEHGNSEHDRGPFAYFNHSMGPRETSQTVRAALENGFRFGFVASSDSHSGFPGAYGEGLMAVHSRGRDRQSIIQAINNRHTYALTGDRCLIDFSVDGHLMGSTIAAGETAEIAYRVECPDAIDVVEIIQDGGIVHRDYPTAPVGEATVPETPFHVRFEWGWGPWGDLALERIADWEFDLTLEGGKILDIFPCLQSGPFDEDRRHRFDRKSDHQLSVISYSSRRGAYRQNPNQSLVVKMTGDPSTRLNVNFKKPTEERSSVTVEQLQKGSVTGFTGPFPKECFHWHRLVLPNESRVSGTVTISPGSKRSYAYLRVKQENGHVAWTSPVFMNYA